MANATCPVRRERRLRAAAFGTYPTASAAAVTRASVSGCVLMPLSARDADATETFARRATVVMVGVSGFRCKGLRRTFTAAGRLHKIGAAVKGEATRSGGVAEIRLEIV